MNPKGTSPETNPWMAVFNIKALTVGAEVGCATLIIVLVAVFGGIGLDRALGTKPLFTIAFVLLSAPFSLALTIIIAKRAVKDMTKQPDKKVLSDNHQEEISSE